MGKAFGISSLVCGILSILMCIMPYFSVPLGVLAMVFFGISKKKYEKSGMAIAGLVTGIIGTIIGCIMGLLVLMVLSLGMV